MYRHGNLTAPDQTRPLAGLSAGRMAGLCKDDYIDCWSDIEKNFDGTPGLK